MRLPERWAFWKIANHSIDWRTLSTVHQDRINELTLAQVLHSAPSALGLPNGLASVCCQETDQCVLLGSVACVIHDWNAA